MKLTFPSTGREVQVLKVNYLFKNICILKILQGISYFYTLLFLLSYIFLLLFCSKTTDVEDDDEGENEWGGGGESNNKQGGGDVVIVVVDKLLTPQVVCKLVIDIQDLSADGCMHAANALPSILEQLYIDGHADDARVPCMALIRE